MHTTYAHTHARPDTSNHTSLTHTHAHTQLGPHTHIHCTTHSPHTHTHTQHDKHAQTHTRTHTAPQAHSSSLATVGLKEDWLYGLVVAAGSKHRDRLYCAPMTNEPRHQSLFNSTCDSFFFSFFGGGGCKSHHDDHQSQVLK